MILQSLAAFLASLGFGILFQVPRQKLGAAGLTGAVGWIIYLLGLRAGVTPSLSTFGAALIIGLLCDGLDPMVLSIPGIIPLVPGTTVYQAHLAAMSGRLTEAGSLAVETVLCGAAIAAGLGLARWMKIAKGPQL